MLNQLPPLDLTFQALADPTRRAMIERLSRSPVSVSDLARPLAMSLPAVMQHLAVLESSGLVVSQKVGRVRTCRLDPLALNHAQAWIAARRVEWERRLDRLGAYLEEMKSQGDSVIPDNERASSAAARSSRSPAASPRPARWCSRLGAAPSMSSAGSARRAARFPRPKVDFRPGGAFAVCMRLPDGQDFWSRGQYGEIAPPDRLTFTSSVIVGGEKKFTALTTVTFTDDGAGTPMSVHQAYDIHDAAFGGAIEGAARVAHHAGQAGARGRAPRGFLMRRGRPRDFHHRAAVRRVAVAAVPCAGR